MANKLEVQIVALDNFTRTFRNLNNQASRAVRPVVNIHRQLGALGRELHLDRMAAGMGRVAGAAVHMSRAVGLSIGPLEGLLGIGAAGGIVAGLGAAAAGAVVLGVKFAQSGAEVKRTADQLGMGTDQLQRLRGAAKLSHVETDDLNSSLMGLRESMWGAKTLSDPAAAHALAYLGVEIKTTKDGFIDLNAAAEDIGESLKGISDPHLRAAVAGMFHLSPDTTRFLAQGRDKVRELGAEAERLGVVDGPKAIKWSTDFSSSLDRLGVAADGAWKKVGRILGPALSGGVDGLTNTITSSTSNRYSAAMTAGGMLDKVPGMGLGSALLRFYGGQGLLRQNYLASSAEARTMSGMVDGPSWHGPIDKPAGTGAAGANMVGDPGPMRFTEAGTIDPEWQAAADKAARAVVASEARGVNASPGDRAALTRELARRDSAAADSHITVDVNLKGAPPGTTARARTVGGDFVPTRVQYSLPSEQ